MQPTTTKYKSLPPLARCLLIITALKTKIDHKSRFVSTLSQMNYRIPANSRFRLTRWADANKEFTNLRREGWIKYANSSTEHELTETINDFELLKMAHSIEPVLFEAVAETIRSHYPAMQWGYYGRGGNQTDNFIRDFKIAIVTDNLAGYNQAFLNYQNKTKYISDVPLEKAYAEFDSRLNDLSEDGYFQYIGENILQSMLSKVLFNSLVDFADVTEVFLNVTMTLEKLAASSNKAGFEHLFDNYAMVLLCRGAFSEFWALCEKYPDNYLTDLFKGLQFLLQGEFNKSSQFFQKGYSHYRKTANRSLTHYPEVNPNIFYFISRARYLGQHFGIMENGIKHYVTRNYSTISVPEELLETILFFAQNKLSSAQQEYEAIEILTPLDGLLMGWVAHWLEISPSEAVLRNIKKTYTLARNNGFEWMQMEAAAILNQFVQKSRNNYEEVVTELSTKLGAVSLMHMMPKVEHWERTLLGLEGVLRVDKADSLSIEKTQNLVFFNQF